MDSNARALLAPHVRAISRGEVSACGDESARFITADGREVYTLRTSRGGSRSITREIRSAIKERKQELKDELYEIGLADRATNLSMWGGLKRSVLGSGGSCAPSVAPQNVEIISTAPASTSSIPDLGNSSVPPSGEIPPPRAMRSLEARVAALETDMLGLNAKADLILAKLK